MTTPEQPSPLIQHDPARARFETRLENQAAYLTYSHERDRPRTVSFDHTFVPETLRGRGFAGALVRAALEEARASGWRVIPRCSYVAAYLERHPEFQDLAAE